MENNYKTIYDYGEDEYIVKKSRFIGYARPIKNEEEALEFIEKISKHHYDATHNVYAYVLGKDSNVQRFSDDGEPSGTAGIPVLEVLKKENLRNVVVVVTRYFGGIKLGGGGLIRAYTKGAKIAIDAAKVVDMVLHKKIQFNIDYDLYGKLENYLINNNLKAENINYGKDVEVIIYISFEFLNYFKKYLIDITSGDIEIKDLGSRYLPVYKNKRLKLNKMLK